MSRAAAIDLRDFPRASDHAFVCAAKGAPMAESRSDLVLEVLRSWPAYAVTPLYAFESLASELRLGGIFYKDESSRFDLNSFKSLGAAYALSCEVARELGLSPGAAFEQLKEAIARRGAPFRVVCATDGNHGRAVAWAAFQLGLEATVLIHPGVSAEREEMIRAEGATVERVPGNYDDSVRQAAKLGRRPGWRAISDTAYEGYEQIPSDIMDGYSVLALEISDQLPVEVQLTHLFVQAGVGGLAAALATAPEFTDVTTVCVEPDRAACLLKSAKSGMRAVVEGELNTIMAGLACGEPSIVAWDKLRHQGASFLSIPEHAAIAAKAVLEHSAPPAVALSAGESGVAGLAGLICASIDTALRKSLALSPLSQVILIGTESSTTLRGRS